MKNIVSGTEKNIVNASVKMCDARKVDDKFHVFVEYSRYENMREKELTIINNCTKTQFYDIMHSINQTQLKKMTNFMITIEEMKENEEKSNQVFKRKIPKTSLLLPKSLW